MKTSILPNLTFPATFTSPSGLVAQLNGNGSVRRMDFRDIMLNLFLGNEMEGGPANVYLRRHGSVIEATPLLGPLGPAVVHWDGKNLSQQGEWRSLRFRVVLVLAESEPAWFWRIRLENPGDTTDKVDLVYVQDLALAHYTTVRLNEYYVSQYVDHTPLAHPRCGLVLASRQNLAMAGRAPWTLIGSLGRGVSIATDALQVYGLAGRAGRAPDGIIAGLPGSRRQHEHSMAAIQDRVIRLEPGAVAEAGFFGWFEPDHPAASSAADLVFADRALALPEAAPGKAGITAPAWPRAANLFGGPSLLESLDLDEFDLSALFGRERYAEEREAGRLLSFFLKGGRHVVLKEKELRVLRPHGHILRTGNGWTPDEASLTTTTWMGGVFNSMLTQGHVSINRFLSTARGYLGLLRAHGQRVFVELAEGWQLLDQPSAYEMASDQCRWFYKHRDGFIEVRTQVCDGPDGMHLLLEIRSGLPLRFLIANHLAVNGDDGADAKPIRWVRDGAGVLVRPMPGSELGRRFPEGGFRIDPTPGTEVERLGGDELLFADGQSHRQPFLCLLTASARTIGFRVTGRLVTETRSDMPITGESAIATNTAIGNLVLEPPAGSELAGDVERLGLILPWFTHDALIHYLAPRGLEQFSGGGWGTRDVAQGPEELLLALGRLEPLKDLLVRVFANQNPNGDWPQWFMFYDRERNIRPEDSHGDIVFWPLLALAHYLSATDDGAFLDRVVPFFHPAGATEAEHATIRAHVGRALEVIRTRVIAGTQLAAYGNGDWNDSLQPADPAMREHLCSAWTVTLHHQTLSALDDALRRIGRSSEFPALGETAGAVRADFQKLLIVDGVLAGFAVFQPEGNVEYLLHPRDRATGVTYSLLPMIHAILDGLLTPEQAATHLGLIRQHLLGPDGARLFDRPLEYQGGPQRLFQRAESSSFFGREIGLMYTHAHLRYAEALAHYGDAEGFFDALCLANPIAIQERVPAATRRQANCYYSSSDAVFADRYQAHAEYGRVMAGEVALDGGWRLYSSGAGIATRLTFECFLGLRRKKSRLVIDPAIPKALDGLKVRLDFAGQDLEVLYRVKNTGVGPVALQFNGDQLPFERLHNPYRTGAAEVGMDLMAERLVSGLNRLTIQLG